MDNNKNLQPWRPQVCCVEHAFHFVLEAPVQGLQPSQRSNIRSHVMKRYKHNQKRAKQGGTEISCGTRGTIMPAQELINGEPLEQDNQGLQPRAGASESYTARPRTNQRQKYPLDEGSDHPQWLDMSSELSMTESSNATSLTSPGDRIQEVSRSYCPMCGAPQPLFWKSNEPGGTDQSAKNAFSLVQTLSRSDPREALGAGRVDPFQSYPVDNASPHLHKLIDHCKSSNHSIHNLELVSFLVSGVCLCLNPILSFCFFLSRRPKKSNWKHSHQHNQPAQLQC
jgi:hypothetical protein